MSDAFVSIGGEIIDGEYAICPWCGEKHGDCWEWVELEPAETRCQGCDNVFTVWSEVDVQYHAKKPAS